MPFDLSTAKPEQQSTGFDISTAQPEQQDPMANFNPMQDITLGGVSGSDVAGGLNLAQNIATGMAARPIAGGIALKDVIQGKGQQGAETVERITSELQTPLSPEGEKVAQGLGGFISELGDNPAFANVVDMLKTAKDEIVSAAGESAKVIANPLAAFTGQDTQQQQVAGDVAKSVVGALPETALEVAPFVGSAPAKVVKTAKNITKASKNISRDVKKMLSEAAPSAERLKAEANKIYTKIDDLGVNIESNAYKTFADDVAKTMDKMGVDEIISPKANRAMNRVLKLSGENVKVSEIEKLRKIAGDAAKSVEGSDKALGSELIRKVDSFIETLKPSQVVGGNPKDVGNLLKSARDMWSRTKKSDTVSDMVNVAENYQSGFESGLRNQATNLLRSKKKLKGFTPDEIKAIQKISRGGGVENTAKFLSKFGIGEKQQTGALMALLGAGVGGAAGGFGGMVVLPAVGTLSGKLALKLTKGNAKYLDDIVRAGKDGKKIVTSYMKNTPKSDRNVRDLTELLMQSNVNIKNIGKSNQLVSDATYLVDSYTNTELMGLLGLTTKEVKKKESQ